jgi:hypothetical protein
MKTIFLLFAALVIGISSHAQEQTPPPALQFNNEIVKITDSLFIMGQAWGNAFKKANQTKEFKLLTEPREKLDLFLQSRLAALRKQADVGVDGKELREAMIRFLEFEQNLFKEAFLPFEKLDANSTQEAINAVIEKLKSSVTQERDEIAKLQEVQAAYGKKNGFTIQGN